MKTATELVEQWHLEWVTSPDAHWGDKISWHTANEIAQRIDEANSEQNVSCDLPPEGWYCTREKGHEGPCAAYPEN